jgi:hypothetical protein
MIRRVWNKVVGCIKDGAGKQGGASLYKCIEGGEGMTVGRGQTINSSRCRSENVDFDAINALSSLCLCRVPYAGKYDSSFSNRPECLRKEIKIKIKLKILKGNSLSSSVGFSGRLNPKMKLGGSLISSARDSQSQGKL